jgi:hypothetical protein
MVFLFAFYLEQHPIVCPLKCRIMGYFSLSHIMVFFDMVFLFAFYPISPAVVITDHAEMHGI